MKIEILTKEMSKKAEILTYLANEPDLQARGQEVELPDLKLDIGDNYLLFVISTWERAEQIVPLLFSIRPNAYSPSYFEPYTEQKILITTKAKSILDIIPEMSAVEHLNLELAELAGFFEVKWQSRDVVILAKCYLMVEGEVAICKVKFETINRETEYQCQDCIQSIHFYQILAIFADELLKVPSGPIASGPAIEAKGSIEPQKWSEFINQSKARIDFDSTSNEIRLSYSENDYINFIETGEKRNFILYITNPNLLTSKFLRYLCEKLDVNSLELRARIDNVTFDLNTLVNKLRFKKDNEFYNFTFNDGFIATYNVKSRVLVLETKIEISNYEYIDQLIEIIINSFTKIQDFLDQVNHCVI